MTARRVAYVWFVALLANCASPPSPQTGCRLDSECTSGRCLGGICVVEDAAVTADIAADTDGKVDSSAETSDAQPDQSVDTVDATDAVDVTFDATATCSSDADCLAAVANLGTCLTGHCQSGSCQIVAVDDDVACATVALCPAAGACLGGTCQATGKPCDDGEPCTIDSCAVPGGCAHTPKPDGIGGCDGDSPCTLGKCTAGVCDPGVVIDGACHIGAACFDAGASQPGKPCARCLPASATSTWTLLDEGPCNDGDACTQDDGCAEAGACVGTLIACTDDNPCTDNSCDAKTGCVTVANQLPCDDGNPCSWTDGCMSGACVPLTWNPCDDANPCTSDLCDPVLGCIHAPTSGPCQFDADPCTTDQCVGGACVGIALASVCTIGGSCVPAGTSADGQPCLVCDPEVAEDAWTPLNFSECDDGNACTAGDTCYGGACIGAVGLCDDKNPCTKNNCTPSSGCVFLPSTEACDDGNLCTSGDNCGSGKCVGLAAPASACDDANPCTDDSCLPVAGCAHAPNLLACNDGDACTSGDFCTAGTCHAAHVICSCAQGGDCNDGNPCTVDGCDPLGECINTPIAAAICDDGNACTTADHCAKGYCLGVTIACNDNEACSLDGCLPSTGCVFLPLQGANCSDGSACTTGDLCVSGTCTGTPKNCDDGKPCTADTCKSGSGKCEHVSLAEGTTCTGDGAACTIDACVSGECNHTAIVPGLCQIDGVCLSAGAGQLGSPCLGCVPALSQTVWSVLVSANCSDGNSCTDADSCAPSGACVGTPLTCDDGNPCTLDVCNPLGSSGSAKGPCLFAPSAAACDDGDPCTYADTCQAAQCKGALIACDDGNACTLDACVAFVGCQTTPVSGSPACASDGLACTLDLCDGATCSHAILAETCLIAGSCRAAGQAKADDACRKCQPAMAADSWSAATGGGCDDGDPCTMTDLCNAGSCVGSGEASCDDADACTADACTAQLGCEHKPLNATPCQDGDLCTTDDICVAGVCQPGNATICPQPAASTCGISACTAAIGCHFISKCNALEGCFQGACATLDAAALPAPVTVPFDTALAPQPLAPSLVWQAGSGTGEAALPHLRLAVQTRGCAPQLGLYSALALVNLPANHQPMAVQLAPNQVPPVSNSWCAVNPQFLAAAAATPTLALAWSEGGNSASPCDVLTTGGMMRLATVPVQNTAMVVDALAPCPAAGGLLGRPAVALTSPSSSGDLAGILARAIATGVRIWDGDVATAWGGPGAALPADSGLGTSAQTLGHRPLLLQPVGGSPLLLSLSAHTGSAESLFAVSMAAMPADPSGPLQTTAKLAGVDNTSSAVVYRGIDAVWDPDTQQVAVLISGTLQFGGEPTGFLALARTTIGTPLATPTVLRLFAAGPGALSPPVLHAFRLAEVPGSADFLLAFGSIDATSLELLRVHPLSDTQFTVTAGKILANDFVTHETGDAILGFGGLSELAIAPDGTGVSLVYETIGGVRLVSVPMP